MATTFNSLLKKYRDESFSQRDKGERFERLMQAFLLTDKLYCDKFSHVWMWNEFPCKDELGGSDTGIDLVAITTEGDYWAIQCKCYQESAVIDKPSVDSFLATSGRTFKDDKGKTTGFSNRLWISTTNNWNSNATQAISNQVPPVTRLNLSDLQNAPVDWNKLQQGITGELARNPKKELRQHQITALNNTNQHFQNADRGKLIMACGTGKTFTSLRIAENETNGNGLILFLVPSIALLGQTLREWSADAKEPINPICICSDPEITKKKTKNEDTDGFSVVDLALPASTDVKSIKHQFQYTLSDKNKGMTVVFSTYQSIEVIAQAQQAIINDFGQAGIFDLIICDEAHRTTGVTIANTDESAFVKVHDNNFIQAKKRLYMTATPRLYDDNTKSKAAQAEAVLCSMDDPSMYGNEIYRIGFGEAVEKDLLTDYKVLILTLSDKDVPPSVQSMIADDSNEINSDDASKLIGCINALSKQVLGDEGLIKATDPEPMRRAVAFCQNIAISKKITDSFNEASDVYIESLPAGKRQNMVSIESQHIDGTMSATRRDELLCWLKADSDKTNQCRILTNVRCLSEGVDVPSLDAVMFLSARNSQVDVVQSVGRVMRKSPGKKYGYIIIPVVVRSDVEADKALDDNERYKVVWTVLNALRAHDDRFNATVNKIELNNRRPAQILVGRPEVSFQDGEAVLLDSKDYSKTAHDINNQLALQFEQLQSVVFARMVQKVGDRRYWEQWAKNVAEIAERQIERITRLVNEEGKHKESFQRFLKGLQNNINPSITETAAIEMLSQHIITKPVFEALFEGYSFVSNNAVSVSMQTMLDLLEAQAIEKDTETLNKFYESVKMRAAGIDNAEGKQRIIIELYDKFFKTAFPKMVEQLGIVYTPVEVVDFIIHSVNDVLQKEFGRTLSDENVNILDPFTGTGTFITRLLQSGLIKPQDLKRKYTHEIFANEIVLLAYYIAAVNIENTYHDLMANMEHSQHESVAYTPFNGICLTDTFQLGESDGSDKLFSDMFPQNSERVEKLKKAPLRVIIGNPPYSVGQKSANDNAQNQSYPNLESRIEKTYIANVDVTQKRSLYDSYIKAFRWSSDRIDSKHGGIIAFVSNGSWIDGNAAAGFRKCLEKEFSSIYVFNLRGNQRTSGELSRKEGGKIFGSGSRTPIAITLLVKKTDNNQPAQIFHHDIGDYLSREEKLSIISKFKSIANFQMSWIQIIPNEHGDWLNQRKDAFGTFIPIGEEKKQTVHAMFSIYSNGLKTNRDAWVYNSSENILKQNIIKSIEFYNKQRVEFHQAKAVNLELEIDNFIDYNSQKIAWTLALKNNLKNNNSIEFKKKSIRIVHYRPFFKQKAYYNRKLNEVVGTTPKLFPITELSNLVICVSGVGVTKDFSTIITNTLPDLELIGKSQCFPLYYYEENKRENTLFDSGEDTDYIRRDGVSDYILCLAQKAYGNNVSKEDIFYFVYGFLHSPDYRAQFANDLKKMLPRLPLVEDVRDFWAFSKAGRKLADLHLNYETVEPCKGVVVLYNPLSITDTLNQADKEKLEYLNYRVEKMRFPKKGQKDTIIYNSQISIENIPAKAYEYVVNGKSAIEWIMERYQVTTHKESQIKNDPNDWALEHNQPRYILDLLLSIINVSVQTVDIVNELPRVKFE